MLAPADTVPTAPLDQTRLRWAPASDPIAADRLRELIERIECLMADRGVCPDPAERERFRCDILDVMQDAIAAGFDAPTIRTLIDQRAIGEALVRERHTILLVYRRALGMPPL